MANAARQALEELYRYNTISDHPVGQGGCGQVWKCHDLLFDRVVAIKTISEFLSLSLNDTARRTFVREAQAGARLGRISRHVVKVIDLGMIRDTPYFVMEWIERPPGKSKIDLSGDVGAVSVARMKKIMFEVSDAVATAHQSGIVHSDISPWNFLYDPAEKVYKLSDFGLLKIIEETLVSRGSGSLLVGGRADFFPQSVRAGAEPISYASDVYALAVTLRVILEGEGCLSRNGGKILPTPGVIPVRHEGGRDAPSQVRLLVERFVDGHGPGDTVIDFQRMLQQIPS
ncbi:hypothetical protein Aco04nite_36230 [Winogradskya consettensis]|uniref:non-specific serine/threonine protein kinase n=1 Tax=Winogradskya consettensis TaxID=113560 RepID=A0A919SJ01_9ACTN|nr:hypothetical protein Aco04nite_36230 [Actinoplanes consettensis]